MQKNGKRVTLKEQRNQIFKKKQRNHTKSVQNIASSRQMNLIGNKYDEKDVIEVTTRYQTRKDKIVLKSAVNNDGWDGGSSPDIVTPQEYLYDPMESLKQDRASLKSAPRRRNYLNDYKSQPVISSRWGPSLFD